MNAPLPKGIAQGLTQGLTNAVPHLASATEALRRDGADHPAARSSRRHRRRRHGEREADMASHNHATERWMVSYADFITLLFAFFVVMYAISSVNEDRYRVLSGALSAAFSPGDPRVAALAKAGAAASRPLAQAPPPAAPTIAIKPDAATAPAAGAEHADLRSPDAATEPADAKAPAAASEPPISPADRKELARDAERLQHMEQLAMKVDRNLLALVRDGQVRVTRGARGIAIEINAAVLFDAARAELKPASAEPLRSVAKVLAGFVEPIQVEGHTDDLPIATHEYRSNWELSAARAASVARFLIDEGIAPGRMGAAGYAEFRPLAANRDAESRQRNRRVTLMVLSADEKN